MRKLVVLVVLAAGAYFIAWPKVKEKLNPNPEQEFLREARQRSENVLRGMQGTSDPKLGTPEQFALSQWALGKIMLDNSDMELYSNRFDAFRQRKGLFHRIQEYEILDVTVQGTGDDARAIVSLRVDGARYKWVVPQGQPITWAD